MFAAVFAFSIGLLLFALSAEAQTVWLEVVGTITAIYFILAGAYVGWRTARK